MDISIYKPFPRSAITHWCRLTFQITPIANVTQKINNSADFEKSVAVMDKSKLDF